MRVTGACLFAAAAIMAGGASTPAMATPAEGDVQRTDLAKGETTAPITIVTDGRPTTVLVQNLTLKPGAHSGWHTHPGPEYSVITSGVVALQTAEQCASTDYPSGQVVFIPEGVPHRVDNHGPVDAGVVVNYTLPVGEPVRADAPDACLT